MAIHLKLFNDAQWETAKAALNAEKHNLIVAAGSEVQKLETLVQAKYPALVDAFKTAFNDVEKDPTTKGFAKMEKVVLDLLPKVPALASELSDLPNLKSFMFGLGTQLFNDTIGALEGAAKALIDNLVK